MKSLSIALFLGLVLGSASVLISQERPHGPEFRAAGDALMCQCGCGATISNCSMDRCHSAEPIREEIWERLQNGESITGIVDVFKERYGLIILSAPPASGFHLTAWLVPLFALILGAFATRHVLRSWTRQSAPAVAATPITSMDRARIERELKDLS